VASEFSNPECDGDGNIYINTWPDGVHAIHKLNARGERVAVFLPNSPGVRVDMAMSFSIAPDGDVYQLIHGHDGRYVFVYRPNGSLKSTIKLRTGFVFKPSRVTAFATGDLLVSGLEYDKDRKNPVMWPFTGIFSSDGTLRKELALADDDEIHDLAVSGDERVTPAGQPSVNVAVQAGTAKEAEDGNIYLMRRLSPAIIYAISPGGDVRRFTIDPGRPDFMPGIGAGAMHIAGDRIAVLFFHPQTGQSLLKVVDLKGREVATYEGPDPTVKPALGLGFVCYDHNPERFTFLETADDHKLQLITAMPLNP
jgi:hypothetical protein